LESSLYTIADVVVRGVDGAGSDTQQYFNIKATAATLEQIIMTCASPNRVAAGSKSMAPTKAPSLPEAALIPFNVDRHSGEYNILGKMNVVVLGP
jgi:hypothetical protein